MRTFMDLGMWALENDNDKVMGMLTKNAPIVHDSWLYHAARTNSIKCLKLLLKEGRINPGQNRQAALRVTCAPGKERAMALLLEDPRVSIEEAIDFCREAEWDAKLADLLSIQELLHENIK